jgi:biopolymer transport protein ExbD
MPRLLSRAFALLAVLLLTVALFAVFQLQERRSWGGGMVQAPAAQEGRPWTVDQARALLAIDQNGQYYFNRRPIRNETLSAVLDSAFRGLPRSTPLYVYAATTLEAGVVDQALRIARASGVQQVSLVAEPTDIP